MRRFLILPPLTLPVLLTLPCLLLLPTCGGKSADDPAEAVATETPPPLSEVPSAQAAYDQAMEILAEDRAGAIALLRDAINLDPDFLEAFSMASYQLALLYQNTDRSQSHQGRRLSTRSSRSGDRSKPCFRTQFHGGVLLSHRERLRPGHGSL